MFLFCFVSLFFCLCLFSDSYFSLPQVHQLEKSVWETTEVVNIDIADRSCINPKVNTWTVSYVLLHISFLCWLYITLLFAWFPFRNTRKNLIQPSLSQWRQVEGLWDLTGRYCTCFFVVIQHIKIKTHHFSFIYRKNLQTTPVALICVPTSWSLFRPRFFQ